jgi:hypothetical protein
MASQPRAFLLRGFSFELRGQTFLEEGNDEQDCDLAMSHTHNCREPSLNRREHDVSQEFRIDSKEKTQLSLHAW